MVVVASAVARVGLVAAGVSAAVVVVSSMSLLSSSAARVSVVAALAMVVSWVALVLGLTVSCLVAAVGKLALGGVGVSAAVMVWAVRMAVG